jgi:hypothetical protein
MLLAVFVMAILSSLGIALLFLGETNLKLTRTELNIKKAFYLAETGIEDGRRTLYDAAAGADTFGPWLEDAAGDDDMIGFDPRDLVAEYDADGEFVGLSGYTDDVPLLDTRFLGQGLYAAFLTNDPIDGRTNLTDTNSRVMITGVGIGPNRSFRVVEAIVEPHVILPPVPPSAITLIGSDPFFDGGSSNGERYSGEDCHFLGGGQPDLNVPIVGTTSPDAELDVEANLGGNPNKYTSGGYSGEQTGVDMTNAGDPLIQDMGLGTLDSVWLDCNYLQELTENLYKHATHYCDMSVGCTEPQILTMQDIFFVDGDINLGPGYIGSGVLVVTGELTLHGSSTWTGIVLAIGEGKMRRVGGGNGVISGTSVVANISGPNGIYGDSDDCRPVPVADDDDSSDWTDPDLFGPARYDVTGGGNADIDYCTRFLPSGPHSYRVVDFRQI